eukprot:gnl/TRDRNA2_/TRDRNA2_81747_c0_seq1.p1 gnl/TRDRNA2_/TRDRNA2_81747_c0~~gnl/TRDRNA2_/TRDRNA2_81747_c0_seq1.p1  ORF type:complete len:551 (+),score=108.65 gnl/TRDRNA2_/TRDRNA2_81747_c0_seq1:54-1655(+)
MNADAADDFPDRGQGVSVRCRKGSVGASMFCSSCGGSCGQRRTGCWPRDGRQGIRSRAAVAAPCASQAPIGLWAKAPVPSHEAAEQLRKSADSAYLKKDLAQAEMQYAEAARAFGAREDAANAAVCWTKCGSTRLALDRLYDALGALEMAVKGDPTHWQGVYQSTVALDKLGLLDLAADRLQKALTMKTPGESQFRELLKRVKSRIAAIESGDGQILMEEIQRLGSLIDDKEAGFWISEVGERARTKEGRDELVEKGFLTKAHRNLPNPVDVARRASYVALKYRVNKRMQRALSAAGFINGMNDPCVLPSSLKDPSALELLTENACADLSRDRLAVIDGAFSEPLMRRVKGELQAMRAGKLLQNDQNDVCNPLQEAKYMPFLPGEGGQDFQKRCPCAYEVVRRICGMPLILEENLGLRLAVPQSVMLACYPPKASYKMHLDSYALQGGHEDVPRKVTILLYFNLGWTPKLGGQLRYWKPFDAGKGTYTDIQPLPGRIVAFMAEEIWHEVTESFEDRYALTLWVHDRDRVEVFG